MAKYGAKLPMQPGVYDPNRGGLIDTYPVSGPVPFDINNPKPVGERLEMASSAPDRTYISWQGWVIPAGLALAHEINDQAMKLFYRELVDKLVQQKISGMPFLSSGFEASWNMYYPITAILGRLPNP